MCLVVYPYYVKRHARAEQFELASITFFEEYFSKKYPNHFHVPQKIEVPIPALEIKNNLPLPFRKGFGYPLRNSILYAYGVQYAASLLPSENVKCRTLFSSIVASDADQTMHSTLTTLRTFMLHVCTDMGDWDWQVASLLMEPEMGHYFDKDFLIQKSFELQFPVEFTRTCIEASEIQCGVCPSCFDRRRVFKELNIEDKTTYLHN